ncbi:MATE family efflux transporter [Thalassotalea fonticola]|uniref:MATE family efflux transporter n=1 Tax=Thalassotalea fonticola TaxID=3065649 RepID=A0ABZ0GQ76_9GAMM|nr:MATE family efflux transporter [Colwelliaceae bacterium S1-1]
MFGAILALLLYDLLESSLLALSGVNTLAAIGFTLPLTTAMTAMAIGLSIRSNNKIVKSDCLDKSNLASVISTSLLMSVLIVSFFALCAYASNQQLLSLLGNEHWAEISLTNEKVSLVNQQKNYMAARYISWVFLALIWQVNAIFRALGHGVLASNLMFSWLTVKSILALLLLLPSSDFFFSALSGLAYVHVVSDLLLALISLVILIKKLKLSFPSLPELKFQLTSPKKDAVIVILQQLITPISMALLTIIAANIDYSYVAAFAFILRMESLFLLIPMVLTTSMPAIIGSNFWVGNKQRVQHAYFITFSTIILIQLIIAVVLFFYSPLLSTMLCSQDTVANYISRYFIWVSWGYLSMGCIMVYQSCLNAKGKTTQALILGIFHRIVFLLLFSYIGSIYALQEDYYQGMQFGHVINAAITINDHFYQGILSGHIASGVLLLMFLSRNKTLNPSASNRPNTLTQVDILNFKSKPT